eukprot:2055819-Pyramimonas_sp.AAC.1
MIHGDADGAAPSRDTSRHQTYDDYGDRSIDSIALAEWQSRRLERRQHLGNGLLLSGRTLIVRNFAEWSGEEAAG